MLNMKDFNEIVWRRESRLPHGLSRMRTGSGVLPAALGLVCAMLVLGVLWLAYTFG
ncbi:hypothetical protein [Acidocella sp.]|uniref:hypothetical protein n=1 Tax=Acidocella sp. TaxID=50710 RepID=UPI0026249A28|nr:hypothetical protein [Acidocella sp.]